MAYNKNLKINGPSFALSYKRTTYKPLDASSVFETYEDAVTYANNMLTDCQFVPYPGQVIAVINDPTADNNNVYKLVKDTSLTEQAKDGRNHCKLEKIGGMGELKETFTQRNEDEQVSGVWTFRNGLNIMGLLNAVNILATLLTVREGVKSDGYTSGSKGFSIYQDQDNKSWNLDIDNVQIRGSLGVNALKVNTTEYLGGESILTVGGSIEATTVEKTAGGWKVYFKNEDGKGKKIHCQMQPGDFAKCQTWNEDTASQQFYWLEVKEVGDNYITLARKDGDTMSYTEPREGDEIIHLGNKNDKERQAALIFSAREQAMRIYTGIDTTSLSGASVPINLNPVQSEILARFITLSSGTSLETAWTDISNRVSVLIDEMAVVKSQQDKQFIIWFGDYTPTLTNTPYTDWVSDERDERDLHLKDIFYNRNTSVADGGGRACRFEKDPAGNYLWHEITDKDTLLALEKAAKAQDTADGKRRVFVEQPTVNDAYDPGDMWTNATYTDADGNKLYENDTLVVQKGHGKAAGEPFNIGDWRAASSATTAYLGQLSDSILAFVTNTNNSISDIQGELREAQSAAATAALEASRAAGLADSAQVAAESAVSALQFTNDNITALVGGKNFNADGTLKEEYKGIIDATAGRVATLAEKLTFDPTGKYVTNIDKSGLVATATWAAMFTDHTDENGVTVKAQISTLIENGISQAQIRADQITIEGSKTKIKADLISLEGLTTVNNNFKVLADGSIEAVNGKFTGEINATSGVFSNIVTKDGKFKILADGSIEAVNGKFSGHLVAESIDLAICDRQVNGSIITMGGEGGDSISGFPEYTLPALDEGQVRIVYMTVPMITRVAATVTLRAAEGALILPDGKFMDQTDEYSTSAYGLTALIGVRQTLSGRDATYWYVQRMV